MSLVGMGRAFNLRFMPNGPLRTNCYHRPMPFVGFGHHGGGNVSYTENINIQNGPTGFWGFMTGLTQGLFGGGMFGMGGGGLFDMIGMLKSSKTPQGPQQAQQGEDQSLKNLIQVHGKNYEIVSHPSKSGIYQAIPKGGGELIEGTYDEVMNKCCEAKESKPQVQPQPEVKEEPPAVPKEDLGSKPVSGDDESSSGLGSGEHSSRTGSSTRTGSSHRAKGSGSGDWYRAANNNQDGKAVLNAIRPGMSARQVTDLILHNKVNYLAPGDRDKLAAEVLRKNPSVFDKDGKVKAGFDPTKLDIPTIAYIKGKHVGSSSGMTTTKGTREATGTYKNHTIGETLTSKTGRYAKKIDGQWRFYAKDGSELKPEYVKDKDNQLWMNTWIYDHPIKASW